ncbi:hypothetical protein ERX27_07620 [Macrococcus brunensis]|uniref:Uncharacterized protein n=1 Tax=Macrococcus brunensis TaxID=198483 RepID=A0A4V3BDA9_9STAP|nr:hypothetical protein [Macrococcus brunensis]TDL96715.1 hypothetical protein ERX27_07620 [Macrococcus brunensis]
MGNIKFDPQLFANAYLSNCDLDDIEHSSEEDRIDYAFSIYLAAFNHALEFIESIKNDDEIDDES